MLSRLPMVRRVETRNENYITLFKDTFRCRTVRLELTCKVSIIRSQSQKRPDDGEEIVQFSLKNKLSKMPTIVSETNHSAPDDPEFHQSPWSCFNIKTIFPSIEISSMNIRHPWDGLTHMTAYSYWDTPGSKRATFYQHVAHINT